MTLGPDDLARVAADVLAASPLPALVLDVGTGRIFAADPRVALLLDPAGPTVIGNQLEDYTADHPVIGPDLLAGGHLNGYETFRVLRRPHGSGLQVRMWVRTFEHEPPSQFVLVILLADQHEPTSVTDQDYRAAPAVVGTADADMRIEQISHDAENLFGMTLDQIVGRSLTEMIVDADRPAWIASLDTASAEHHGVSVNANVELTDRDGTRRTVTCEILLLPLQPAQTWAFILLPTYSGPAPASPAESLSAILTRLGRGAELAQMARGVLGGMTDRDVPGLGSLSTRELEIVGRLLEGDRVPAIARRLFVTQSTIRNHLAGVFAKVGVHSQQELVNLFRHAPSDENDAS
jgi:PAS domain S-box-containing protein